MPAEEVAAIPDDRFLAEFTNKAFQSDFVWRVVRQKLTVQTSIIDEYTIQRDFDFGA